MKTNRLLKTLLVPFCPFLFLSCSEKENLPGNDDPATSDTYISPVAPHGHITVIAEKSHTGSFLGAGYDIMGEYISNSSIKEPVFDLNKIDEDRITNLVGTSSEGDGFEGNDVEKFLRSITRKKDIVVPSENANDLLFTATVTNQTCFEEPYGHSSQYTFAFESSGANAVIQRLNTSVAKWSSWLSDDFRQALEEELPESIVERFGTHILVTAKLGYMVKTLYRSVVADSETELVQTSITGMRERQSKVYKIPNISITFPEETVKKNYGGTIVVLFQGGDYKSLPPIELLPNEVIGNPMDIKPWIQTSNKDTYALTTLSGNDLVPIYNVIADPEKKKEVKAAVTAYIKAHQPSIKETAPLFQASDGKYHRYYTSYKELSDNKDICQGAIGSLFIRKEAGTVPLYRLSNRGNERLSIVSSPNGNEPILGYVYEQGNDDLNCIYEISDGKNFAYTTEKRDSYGENNTWKPTGKHFYTKKV